MAATAIECPYCQAELLIPAECEWQICHECGRELQAEAQRLFARARVRFSSAQEALAAAPQRKSKAAWAQQNAQAICLYQLAHSALEEAFHYDLPDSQRILGVEMMADITRLFVQQGLAAAITAGYWSRVAVEQHALRERDALQASLAAPPPGGILALPRRWRRQLRQRQLDRALARLDGQIRQVEQMIGFVDPPRARRPR